MSAANLYTSGTPNQARQKINPQSVSADLLSCHYRISQTPSGGATYEAKICSDANPHAYYPRNMDFRDRQQLMADINNVMSQIVHIPGCTMASRAVKLGAADPVPEIAKEGL